MSDGSEGGSRPGTSIPSVNPYELPQLIFAFNIYQRHPSAYPEGGLPIGGVPAADLVEMIGPFWRCIAPPMAFTVQDNMPGQCSGFTRSPDESPEASGVPFESMLFVTTPIKAFRDRVLVILSCCGPQRTTIFSLGSDLRAELLYDSFDHDTIEGATYTSYAGPFEPLGSVFKVMVVESGHYQLQERFTQGTRQVSPEISDLRSFDLLVRDGIFQLRIVRGPPFGVDRN